MFRISGIRRFRPFPVLQSIGSAVVFMLPEVFDPLRGLRGVGHVGLVHQDDLRLAADDALQNRIAAAHRDPRVDQLRDDVDEL
jgi:hypothetical protein